MGHHQKGSVGKLLGVCSIGLALSVPAQAQTFVVNISGASLLENLVKAPGITNDWLDIDGDGVCGSCGSLIPDQLAPFGIPLGAPGQLWAVQYRVVGSVNGFNELINFGRTFVETNDTTDITTLAGDAAYHNRTLFINQGVASNPIHNPNHPGGFPALSLTDGSYLGTTANITTPPDGTKGIQIDIAPLDVPPLWATRVPDTTADPADGSPGDPNFSKIPGQPGYGSNARFSTNKDGSGAVLNSILATLTGGANLNNPLDPGFVPDANTIYATQLSWAPIATLTNLGTGRQKITYTEMRHLLVTGRAHSGENLVMVTRDRGSGTRNGYNNTIGIDPSFGQGENIGPKSTLVQLNLLGPSWIPGNSGGSSVLERKVQNHRLALGYTGAERGINKGWLNGGRIECLAVLDDLRGATTFHRPDINSVINNETANAYRLGGPASLSSFGDPRSSLVNANGAGPAMGNDPLNINPPMRNVNAANYLNNISRSLENFVASPVADVNTFMPGEVVGRLIVPPQALNARPDGIDPLVFINQTAATGDGQQNIVLRDFVIGLNTLNNPAYLTFGSASVNGLNPIREAGFTYTDGVAAGTNYIDQAGNTILYGSAMQATGPNPDLDLNPARNQIAGDFNNDKIRDWNDIPELIAAWRDRNGGPAWQPGTAACIEILGDFDGDGNFTAQDVRYFADGLAMNPATRNPNNPLRLNGLLDRAQGFIRVDIAFGSNFFGTTLANPSATYDNGDSRADIAGPSGLLTPAFSPIGHDGVVDHHDINHVYKQFRQNPRVTDGTLNWDNLLEAAPTTFLGGAVVGGDLSADINGDLIIDQADVALIVNGILETTFGDVNLDGLTDATDSAIANANLGLAGAWESGDVNGDGTITQTDLDIINSFICTGNANTDLTVDFSDVLATLGAFNAIYVGPQKGQGDADGNGIVNFADVLVTLGNFNAVCP